MSEAEGRGTGAQSVGTDAGLTRVISAKDMGRLTRSKNSGNSLRDGSS
jgi:hypothetical protein